MGRSFEEILEDSLEHAYQSQYYDPQKAHEYYLRTRELKGRKNARPMSALKSKNQKEGWTFAKSQISEAKKADLKKNTDAKTKEIKTLRSKAAAKREQISNKLKAWRDGLSKDTTSKREKLSKDLESKIAAVPTVPKGVSKEVRAKLSAERREKIAAIRGEAAKDRGNLSEKVSAKRETKSVQTKAERVKTATDLKTAVSKARDKYTAARTKLQAKYEKVSQNEYDKIKKNVS